MYVSQHNVLPMPLLIGYPVLDGTLGVVFVNLTYICAFSSESKKRMQIGEKNRFTTF